ncbi:stimulator of interferon genes protein [Discoglossus pictus]
MSSRRPYIEAENRKIIPQPRGHRSTEAAVIFVFIFLIFLYLFGIGTYTSDDILHSMAEIFQIILGWNFLTSLCEFSEEFRHINTRYNGNYLRALKASFNPKYVYFIIPVCIICYTLRTKELSPQFPTTITVLLHFTCHLLCYLFGIQSPVPATIAEFMEKKQLNVAHGLAWSYYVGYLCFVLPSLKQSIKSFNEENHNLLKFPESCKLHILIPLSCRIYDDLKEADENITFVKELPPLLKDRAGIKGRVYKNNVYRILDEEHRPYYCIAEYATPLASLHKMSDIASAAFSKEDRIQQAKLFYRTLKHILESSLECCNSYQLVIYEDSPKTEHHNEHVLSREILNHLKQQHSEEYTIERR